MYQEGKLKYINNSISKDCINLLENKISTCGKHLYYRIISLRLGIWAHKTIFYPLQYLLECMCTKPGNWVILYFWFFAIGYRICLFSAIFFSWIMEMFRQCEPPRYNWNIVGNGVKHHNNPPRKCGIFFLSF
jgi:hypothetical protein